MDLGVVLNGPEEVVEGVAGLSLARAAKVRSARSMSLPPHRIAEDLAAGRAAVSDGGRADGRSTSALRPPTS